MTTTHPTRTLGLREALMWLLCTAGPVAALAAVDRMELPGVGWGDLWRWLEVTSPEAALAALGGTALRAAAVWVLVSTTITGLGVLSGRPRLTALAARFALPAVRRLALATATRVAAVTLVMTPTVAPVVANAHESVPEIPVAAVAPVATSDPDHPLPPFLVIAPGDGDLPVEAGEADGSNTDTDHPPSATLGSPVPPFLIAESGIGARIVATPASASLSPASLSPAGSVSYTVVPGDHLWAVASRRLAAVRGEASDQGELARYWVQVIEANRHNIRSGDPDLIFPGEILQLPAVDPG